MHAERTSHYTSHSEKESDDFANLTETGYDPALDIDRFPGEVNNWLCQGYSRKESIHNASISIGLNMRTYWMEYVQKIPVIPNPIEFRYKDGVRRVVAPSYGNANLEDIVSANERNGAVRASTLKVAEILRDAPIGSVLVWTSPPGDPQRVTRRGSTPEYKDSQTYVYIINQQGELEALTIITNMDSNESQCFLKEMGCTKYFSSELTEKERAEEIVRTVSFNQGTSQKQYTFEDVIGAMERARKSQYAIGSTTFDQIRELVEKRNTLVQADQLTEQCIDGFIKWASEAVIDCSDESMSLLQKTIADTLLLIVGYAKFGKDAVNTGRVSKQQVLEEMRELGGCNGGGGVRKKAPEHWRFGYCKKCGRLVRVGGCSYCIECEAAFTSN
jgi:hypothetical protein